MTSEARVPAHKPTNAKKILDLLDRVAEKREAEDTLIVAFSGHGVQFKGDRPLADGSHESYFCPEEANMKDCQSLVPLSRVMKVLAECKAERKLLIVDACRNEAVADPAKAVKEIELEAVVRSYRPPERRDEHSSV